MEEIFFDPEKSTSINLDPTTLSTQDINTLRSMILNAYQEIEGIEDILINILGNVVGVRVVLKKSYSNEILEELVSRQLAIYDNPDSKSYLFNFDYTTKNLYEENSGEVSILK